MPSLLTNLQEQTWRQIERTFEAIEAQIFEAREKREASERDGWNHEWLHVDDDDDDPEILPPPVALTVDGGVDPREFASALAQAHAGIKARSARVFEEGFWYLFWACDALDIPTDDDAWDALKNAIVALAIREPVLIYEPAAPQIHVPQLLVNTRDHLLALLRDDPSLIFGVTPRQFEEVIADIFARWGFEVELTQATRDGGRDIIAVNRVLDVPVKCLIECKRYSPSQKVSLGLVQRLYGVKIAEAANKAILATTSDFTLPARQFASQHVWDLDLKSYSDIVRWIRSTRTA